ncbi:MAG: hypothetical protein SX243_14135 [Acidobacteriota bacterium]|nr:hypothetical protein [Acidobacteriota bacterium]
MAEERPLEELLAQTITVSAEEISAETLAEMLSDQLGAPVAVILRDGPQKISVDFKEIAAAELLEVLSQRGAAGVASNGQIFLRAEDIDAGQLSGALTPLLGATVSMSDESEVQRATFELKRVPMDRALEVLGRRFGSITLDA